MKFSKALEDLEDVTRGHVSSLLEDVVLYFVFGLGVGIRTRRRLVFVVFNKK